MKRLAFTNARLFDGDNPPRDGMTVVVRGDRFEQVDDAPPRDWHPDDDLYDLGGRTLMPGMIHGHYHATYTDFSAAERLPVGMEAPPALQTIRATNHLRMALHGGFTGVVSAGAPYAIDAACKVAVEAGLIEGPRIVAGSRDVSTTGHAQDCFEWHWGPGMTAQTNIADGADAFRRAVREEVKRGAEIIKIFATAGHGIFGPSPSLEMTEAELSAAVEAAHNRGARVRAHLAHRDAILASVRLGVDVVDHGDGLDQECIDRMIEANTFLVPSIRYPYCAAQIWSGPAIDAMRADTDRMIEMLPIANKAGLKMTLGDDYGAQPLAHGTYGEELEFYVKVAGIPPLDVIRWATRHGGEMLNRNTDLGTVAPGKLADFLIVDGDPLADIGILARREAMLAVYKGGKPARSGIEDLRANPPGADGAGGDPARRAPAYTE